MRVLNQQDAQHVSGGDLTLTITAQVQAGVAPALASLFAQIVSGQIVGTAAFMTAMQAAIAGGANFDEVRVTDIQFGEFN